MSVDDRRRQTDKSTTCGAFGQSIFYPSCMPITR
jgi:hypothetical protein